MPNSITIQPTAFVVEFPLQVFEPPNEHCGSDPANHLMFDPTADSAILQDVEARFRRFERLAGPPNIERDGDLVLHHESLFELLQIIARCRGLYVARYDDHCIVFPCERTAVEVAVDLPSREASDAKQ